MKVRQTERNDFKLNKDGRGKRIIEELNNPTDVKDIFYK